MLPEPSEPTEQKDEQRNDVTNYNSNEYLRSSIEFAHCYPRDLNQFKEKFFQHITRSQESAAGCFYAFEKNAKIDGKWQKKIDYVISVKMAEAAVQCYRNLSVRTEPYKIDWVNRVIFVWSIALDKETNTDISNVFLKSIPEQVTRHNVSLTYNAASSGAYRNIITRVIGQSIMDEALRYVRKYLNQFESLSSFNAVQNVTNGINYFWDKHGVPKEIVMAKLGLTNLQDATVENYHLLRGFNNQVNDGISIEEIFALDDKSKDK